MPVMELGLTLHLMILALLMRFLFLPEDMGLLSQSNLRVGLGRPRGLTPEYRIMEWTWESRL